MDYGCLPQRAREDLWGTFVEDFNTATLPHEKYYDLSKWEQGESKRKNEKVAP
ncbi:hypothetical protein T484DRAFT_1791346 [Baffinella frigidus]|nr:hypothetical protein T484DRAFT_1791346 [Cryptophyta sp. CCMP2293]